MKLTISLALALLSCASAIASPVEPEHPVYDFLQRLDQRGIIPGGFQGIRPWPSGTVLKLLRMAEGDSARLGAWDAGKLKSFLDEFDPDRRRSATRLHLEDGDFSAIGGLQFRNGAYWQDSVPRPQVFYFGSFEPRMDAEWRELYLLTAAFVGTERSVAPRFTETYFPERGLPYNTNREGKIGIPQRVSTFDGYRSVIGWAGGPVRIEAGQDWNRFGPGHWQNAMLGSRGYFWSQDSQPASESTRFPGLALEERYRRGYRMPGEAAPMPQIRMGLQAGPFSYVKVVAQRDGYLDGGLATLVVHRLEWRALPSLSLGGSEMVTLGGRVPDPVYWIPFVPLKFQEHQARGKDNTALSADIQYTLRGYGRVYGEWMLDDFSGPPFDFWGNKFAWTLGGEWQDPAGFPSTLRAEYSHVDPWVSTHHLPDRQLQHAGALLGSSLPPNSRAFHFQAVTPVWRNLDISLEYAWRIRDSRAPGSSPFDVHEFGVDETKVFDADRAEKRHQFFAVAEGGWRRYVSGRLGLGFLAMERWRGSEKGLASPAAFAEAAFRY